MHRSFSRELTLAARAPYCDGVFMITACRSTIPQLCKVFATAIAPMSSTSEKMSVSMTMGLGLSSAEREVAVLDTKARSARRRNDMNSIAVGQSVVAGMWYIHKVDLQRDITGPWFGSKRSPSQEMHHGMTSLYCISTVLDWVMVVRRNCS